MLCMKSINKYLFFYFMFIPCILYSQNLVKNPSFEDHSICPNRVAYDTFPCTYWRSTYYNGADYYHSCGLSKLFTVPENLFGYYPAKSGNAYIGLLPIGTDGLMEHIQGELTHPLTKGKQYCVKFYVRVAYEASYYFTWKIGAYLSKERIFNIYFKEQWSSYSYIMEPEYVAQVENLKDNYLKDTNNWEKISGVFTAKGGEKYITIGSFYIDAPEMVKQAKIYRKDTNDPIPYILKHILKKNRNHGTENNSIGKNCYYFVDDVSVTPVDSNENKMVTDKKTVLDDTIPKLSFQINTVVCFQNVTFSTDCSELLSQSYNELDSLVSSLNKMSSVSIEISGHTDSTGTETHNLQLSEARARAVADYLIAKGINTQRITYKGYGSSKPIENNTSEEGKAKNRRVEFIIRKK